MLQLLREFQIMPVGIAIKAKVIKLHQNFHVNTVRSPLTLAFEDSLTKYWDIMRTIDYVKNRVSCLLAEISF